jgi:RNA polymerase sigma-70 factor (ECF subfamily)
MTSEDQAEPDVGSLITAARRGDRAAFKRLYERYARMVHGVALARLRPQDADDVVQEVFLRALEGLSTLHDVGAFGGWLAAIARHVSIDAVRRTRQRADLEEEVKEPSMPEHQHDDLEASRALGALSGLPEAYRETMMLRLVEGMTGPEIAQRTGLTPGSVRVNLHRGLKLLRERLRDVGLRHAP